MRETIRLMLLGYKGSGKTMFLTASILASRYNHLGISVHEDIPQSNTSYFMAGIDQILSNTKLDPTPFDQWNEIPLTVEIPGEERIRCITADYPGDLALFNMKTPNNQLLLDFIAHSHCMYLLFDAELSRSALNSGGLTTPAGRGNILERIQGQSQAIHYGRDLFMKQGTDRPVIVLVTKADLLFPAGTPNDEITRGIRELNENDELARARFTEEFGNITGIVLDSKAQKPLSIVYTAVLGNSPKQIPVPGELPFYTIDDPDTWEPIGINHALTVGLHAGVDSKKREKKSSTARHLLRRAKIPGILFFILLFICSAFSYLDNREMRRIDRMAARYEKGDIKAEKVADRLEKAYGIRHPFLYYPGKNLILFRIPQTKNAIGFRKQYVRFGVEKLVEKLHELNDFTDRIDEKLEVFKLGRKLKYCKDQQTSWKDFLQEIDDVKDVLSHFNEPKPESMKDIKKRAIRGYGRFLIEAIDYLWKSCNCRNVKSPQIDAFIDASIIELGELMLKDESDESVSDMILSRIEQYKHLKQCDVLLADYRRVVKKTPHDFEGQFSRLSKGCLTCGEVFSTENLCNRLEIDADNWDYHEAMEIYQVFEMDDHAGVLNRKFLDMITAYRSHVEERKQAGWKWPGRYENEVKAFINWHEGLKKQYHLKAISVKIEPAAHFVEVKKDCKEVPDRFFLKKTVCTDRYIEPHGNLDLFIGGGKLFSKPFKGFEDTIAVGASFKWHPGDAVVVSMKNDGTGEIVRIQEKSEYALLRIVQDGMSGSKVSVKLMGPVVPKMRPSKLGLVSPPLEILSFGGGGNPETQP